MAMLKLVPATGMPVEVTQDSVLVGRDPTCEIVLTDGSVSRRHARIERRDETWFVVDQGSANGTFVDNDRTTETEILDGQELRVGAVSFRVEIEGADSSATVLTTMDQATAVQPGPTMTTPIPISSPSARVAPPPLPGRAPGRPVTAAEPAPLAPRPKRGPWVWVGGGCCGCLVVVLLVVGGIFGYSYKKSSAGFGVVQTFVQDIQRGDMQAAHALLSRAYREVLPLDQFGEWTANHPGLARNTSVTNIGFQSGTSGTEVTVLLVASSGEQEKATFGLVSEDGRMKIASIRFAEGSTSP